MTTFTATALTFDGISLQYEGSAGFEAYKGDVKHFETREEAVEAAEEEMDKFTALASFEIHEHTEEILSAND